MFRLLVLLAVLAAGHGLPQRRLPQRRLPQTLRGVPGVRASLDGQGDLEPEIVGGDDVEIKDFAYQVSMRRYGSFLCGGSILTEKFILTAGHCVYALDDEPTAASVRVGSTLNEGGKAGQLRNVVWAATHPKFDYGRLVYDVALLKLGVALDLSGDNAKRTKLVAPGKLPAAGSLLTVSGWGTLHSGDFSTPDHLQAVSVPVVSLESCRKAYSGQGYEIDETMLCAGKSGKDSCQGDSGGPIVNDQRVQVGVVSWGIGCGSPGFPGVYGNLAHPAINKWIVDQAGLA